MGNYIKRICDEELELKLDAFGAVHIVGPKWCGKTTTAKRKGVGAWAVYPSMSRKQL